MLLIQYFVAFLKGTDDELEQIVTLARKSPSAEDIVSHVEALALARSGRLRRRDGCLPVAVEIAQRAGRRERAGLFEAGRAVSEAFHGNAAAARQSASKALELGRAATWTMRGVRMALSGDLRSRRPWPRVCPRFPEATFVQFMYLPTLRALFD